MAQNPALQTALTDLSDALLDKMLPKTGGEISGPLKLNQTLEVVGNTTINGDLTVDGEITGLTD